MREAYEDRGRYGLLELSTEDFAVLLGLFVFFVPFSSCCSCSSSASGGVVVVGIVAAIGFEETVDFVTDGSEDVGEGGCGCGCGIVIEGIIGFGSDSCGGGCGSDGSVRIDIGLFGWR